jgi:peptidoglycan/xylan/chitin deacetylase (PgdA/CDA1 family)
MSSPRLDSLWSLACLVGLDRAARRAFRRQLLVVCYHGICEGHESQHWLLYPSAKFENDITFLMQHYDLLPLEVALERMAGNSISRPTAAITFDDGYANNLSIALPILEHHGIPATVFLTTELIENGEILWTTRLELALQQTHVEGIEVGDTYINGELGRTQRERLKRAQQIKERLKRLNGELRSSLLNRIFAQVGEPSAAESFALLTPKDVTKLDSSGLISFGAHSKTHPNLSTLSDQELEEEIGGSIRQVQHLKHVTRTFAYPNGRREDYDERSVGILKSCGIQWGLTTRSGLNPHGALPYHIRRLVVGGDMTSHAFIGAASGLRQVLPFSLRSERL